MCEFVDLMLEGAVCEKCGVSLGEGVGYPRRCTGCAEEPDEEATREERETPYE